MPSKSDIDKEPSPAEEPTDEAEESAYAAPSGVGRVWNAMSSAAGRAADATTSAAGQAAGATTSAVSRAADATTSAAGQAADATTLAVSRAADATTLAAGQAARATASAAGNTLDAAASAPKVAFNKVFPECPVPAFMLPTGPGVEDYVFVFHLEEMLDNLKSGIFVRPKIVVWSARDSDYDEEHFIEELEQDFVRQFNEVQGSLTKAFQPHIQRLESNERHLSNEIRREATGPTLNSTARWAALTLLLTPAGALLLIGLGMRPRLKMFGLLSDYLRTRGERAQFVEQFNSEIKKLNSEMHSKNKSLQRAVKRLEVKVHPRIQEIARLICEAERVEFSASEPESEDIPDVGPYLRHTAYLERLPQKYVRSLG